MTRTYATVGEDSAVAEPIQLSADEQNELRAIFRAGVALQDRYVLERRLGSGAMGDVWLARDSKLQRSVAIKVIQPRLLRFGYDPAQFLHESRVGANLIHPAIASVFDHGEHVGKLFTVFEYLPGQTLGELIKTRGRLPLDEVRLIIGPLAQALDLMHARGIIHRDLKPENIRADEHGHFKIVDFGLASQFANQSHWGFCGTPAYAAPEQAAQQPCDGRTDQYALAVIAYELLTGQRPCHHKTTAEFIRLHPACVAVMPEIQALEIPQNIGSALLRSLQNAPSQRFGNCEEFAVALECQMLSRPVSGAEPILEAEVKWRYGMGEWAFARILRARNAHISLTDEALWACFRGEIHCWPLTAIHDIELRSKERKLWFHYQSAGRSKLIGVEFSKPKSQLWAVVLTLLFGPFGMMYSTLFGTVVIALIQGIIGISMLAFPSLWNQFFSERPIFWELYCLGLSGLLTWPIGSVWAAFAVRRRNQALTGMRSPQLGRVLLEKIVSQKATLTTGTADQSANALHPPVALMRGRPISNFQLLRRVEASGKQRWQVEELLMLRAATFGADVVIDLADERIPGFRTTVIRLQGVAAKSVDQQGRTEVTARWFADQTRKLSILLMTLGGLVLVLWFVGIGYFAATLITTQPQFLRYAWMPIAIWTGVAAWPLLLAVFVFFLRWPQLLLPQVAVFVIVALRGILLAGSAFIGAVLTNNWLPAAVPILSLLDPSNIGALLLGCYSAGRTWRIYKYYRSVVLPQDRRITLQRCLMMIPIVGMSLVFVVMFCWIHVEGGLQQSQNPSDPLSQSVAYISGTDQLASQSTQGQVSLTEIQTFQSDLELGDSFFLAGKLPDALRYYQKATFVVEKMAADPSNPAAVHLLMLVNAQMGEVCFQMSRFDDAISFHTKALAIRQKRVSDQPADVPLQLELSVGYSDIGRAAHGKLDYARAIESYESALAILRRLEAAGRLAPEDLQRIKDFEEAIALCRGQKPLLRPVIEDTKSQSRND